MRLPAQRRLEGPATGRLGGGVWPPGARNPCLRQQKVGPRTGFLLRLVGLGGISKVLGRRVECRRSRGSNSRGELTGGVPARSSVARPGSNCTLSGGNGSPSCIAAVSPRRRWRRMEGSGRRPGGNWRVVMEEGEEEKEEEEGRGRRGGKLRCQVSSPEAAGTGSSSHSERCCFPVLKRPGRRKARIGVTADAHVFPHHSIEIRQAEKSEGASPCDGSAVDSWENLRERRHDSGAPERELLQFLFCCLHRSRSAW